MGKITVFLEIFLPARLLNFGKISYLHDYQELHTFLIWNHFPTCTFIWATQLLSTIEYSVNNLAIVNNFTLTKNFINLKLNNCKEEGADFSLPEVF